MNKSKNGKKVSSKKTLIFTIILITFLILVDQISKYIVINNVNEEINLIDNVLSIKLLENSGIAFGINSGNNKTNIIASIIVLCLVIKFLITKKDMISIYVRILLSLIIAGGIGNVIDRIVYGAVVDFIKFSEIPTFNLADFYIVIGWILFVISVIMYSVKKDHNTKTKDENKIKE